MTGGTVARQGAVADVLDAVGPLERLVTIDTGHPRVCAIETELCLLMSKDRGSEPLQAVTDDTIGTELGGVPIRMTVIARGEGEITPASNRRRLRHLFQTMAFFAGHRDVFATQDVARLPVIEMLDGPARHPMAVSTVLRKLPGVGIGVTVSTLAEGKPAKQSDSARRRIGAGAVTASTRHRPVFATQWEAGLLMVDRRLLPASFAVAGDTIFLELPLMHVSVTVGTTGERQGAIGDRRVAISLDDGAVACLAVHRLVLADKGKAAVFMIEPRRLEAIQIMAGGACWRIELPFVFVAVAIATGRE